MVKLDCEVIPSAYEEDMTLDLTPDKLVEFLSLGKAKDVADKQQNAIVLGADTIVAFEKQAIP